MLKALIDKSTIRFQILAAMLMVGLVTLSVVTLQSLHCAHEGISTGLRGQLALLLDQQRGRIEDWLGERGRVLRLVGHSPSVLRCLGVEPLATAVDDGENRARFVAEATGFLARVRVDNPEVEAVAVFDTAWQPVAWAAGEAHPVATLLDPAMKAALEGDAPVVWSALNHAHAGEMAVHVGSPIRVAETGVLCGYVVASVAVEGAMQGLFVAPPASSSMKAYLVDSDDGRYLSAPPSMAAVIGTPAPLDALTGPGAPPEGSHWMHFGSHATAPTARTGEGSVSAADEHAHGHDHGTGSAAATTIPAAVGDGALHYFTDYAGTPVVGMSCALDQLHWRLVVQVDEAEAFGLLTFLLNRAAWSGLAVTLGIALLALWTAKFLARPLQDVTATCRRIAGGSRERRLGHQTGREAQAVATAFNTMLDRLDTTQAELVQAGALAAVGELSASIVHEMRNPVNTIQMNLEALRRKVADDPKLTELHSLAQRQTRRLQDMLTNLLNFSKPIALTLVEQDLRPIATEVLAAARPLAQERRVALFEDLPDSPVMAAVDREHLFRALANLVDNAIQVQPDGGEVHIALIDRPGRAQITVADLGPGIPDAMLDRVFLPFFTTRADGTGLGLSIVRKVVDLHRGEIEVVSDPGAGARFILRLPTHS